MPTTQKKRIEIVLAVALIVVVAATAALAQVPGQGRGRSRDCEATARCGQEAGSRLAKMAERLELTEDQKATIEALQEDSQDQNAKLRKELAVLKNELEGELLKDDPGEDTVVGLVRKIGDAKTEMQANRMKTRLAMREQLTPEQRDRMLTFRNGHRGQGRRGGHGGGQHRGSCGQQCR